MSVGWCRDVLCFDDMWKIMELAVALRLHECRLRELAKIGVLLGVGGRINVADAQGMSKKDDCGAGKRKGRV